jgi:hypothetical protein
MVLINCYVIVSKYSDLIYSPMLSFSVSQMIFIGINKLAVSEVS